MSKCFKCNTDLETTDKSFTGTCNYSKGQYIYFLYCPNKECSNYHVYVDHSTTENKGANLC